MSLLERQVEALLEQLPSSDDVEPEAERAIDKRRVAEALQIIKDGCPTRRSGTASKPVVSSEMWARCAEASVRVGSMQDASDCLHTFFTMCPPTNQFLARAYFCQAYVEDSRIRQWKLRGDKAAEQCLHAISFVLRGLDVATSDTKGSGVPDRKKYSFLVCNAAIAWWKVSRPLRVEVLMTKLVPSLEKLLSDLKAAHDNLDAKTQDPAWPAQLYICQGQCLLDAGDASAAQSAAGAALQYCADAPNLMERAYKLQIHAGGKPSLPANLKVAGTLQEIASGILVGDEKNPSAVSNALHEALNDIHADPVLYSALKEYPDDAHQALVMANEEDEKNKKKPTQECLDLVVEIGRAAIHAGCAQIAEVCALRGKLAKSLRSRVLCQYINAGLAIHALGEEQERYTRRMVAVRLDVLSQLERALQSAERLPDWPAVSSLMPVGSALVGMSPVLSCDKVPPTLDGWMEHAVSQAA